jgi:hypothetical protein
VRVIVMVSPRDARRRSPDALDLAIAVDGDTSIVMRLTLGCPVIWPLRRRHLADKVMGWT